MATLHINLLAVLVVGVINMLVGAIWYSPGVFGRIWMREIGYSDKEMKDMNPGKMGPSYLITFIGALVMAYVTAALISYISADTAMKGLEVGLWVWLGYVLTLPLNDVVFGKKTWNLYFLNAAYYVIVLAVGGAILASWK